MQGKVHAARSRLRWAAKSRERLENQTAVIIGLRWWAERRELSNIQAAAELLQEELARHNRNTFGPGGGRAA